MARITLRDYNNEINDLIDHGQIDEAISHCRHILKDYPKHVDTYRLLGKAYLEQQRYGDAADILQRVLSSIPDDFISQIGMSIIREDEMNLDAAIYHMELAFESQPSNHAIQDELRRLFAKRDGMEPPRIRLTRGALARMYAHGNLFEQAIAEIQVALTEDPKRYDLQTLLADMLHQVDKKVEAAETCTRILEKLPFNLQANRLLAIILKESGREEEAKRFQQRWEALDPYAAFVSRLTPKVELVSNDAVSIEREDWEPTYGGALGGEQPAWASSLGMEIQDDEVPSEVPDWLSNPTEGFSDMVADEPSPIIDSGGEDWMAADASSSESPFGNAVGEPSTDDWMTEFSSPAQTTASQPEDDWMSEFASSSDESSSDAAAGWLTDEDDQPPASTSAKEIPDFMQAAGWGESDGEEQPVSFFDQPDEPIAQGDVPDWMQEMAPSETGTHADPDLGALADIKAEADPDWLGSLSSDTQEPQPDWLGELGEEEDSTPDSLIPEREADPAGFLAGDFGEDDTDDWLASLSGGQPSPSASTDEDAGQDDDWLGSLSSEDADLEAEPAAGMAIPEHEADPAGFLAGDFGEDDTDDWLASLSVSQSTPAPQAEPDQEEDDWLGSLSAEQAEFGKEDDLSGTAIPEREADPAGFLAGDFGEDDTDDWLASFSTDQPAGKPEPSPMQDPFSQPADQAGDDDWLKSLASDEGDFDEEQPEGMAIPEHQADPAGFLAGDFGEDDTDDWLASLSSPEPSLGTEELPTLAPPPSSSDFGEDEAEDDWLDSLTGSEQSQVEEEDDLLSMLDEAPSTPPAAAATGPSDLEDEGLAWLESLAAKQGVAEEELVTSPDKRQSFGDDYTPSFLNTEDEPLTGGEDDQDFANLFGEPEPTPSTAGSPIEDEDDLSMDWLDSISQEAAAEAAAGEDETQNDLSALFGEEPHPATATRAEDESMDWLQQLGGDSAPLEELEGDDLSSLFGEPEAAPVSGQTVIEDEDDLSMDWLDSISQEASKEALEGEELAEEAEDDLSALFGDQPQPEVASEKADDSLDWLTQIGKEAESPAKPASDDLSALLGEPEASGPILEDEDDLSMDWLDSISQEAAVEALAGLDEEPQPEDDLSALFGEEQPRESSTADDEMDWLSTLGKESAPGKEPEGDDLSMDWLKDLEAESETDQDAVDTIPDAPPLEKAPAAESADLQDEGLAWLESLAAKQGVAEEELVTSPEQRTSFDDDRTPDWLKDLGDEETPISEALVGDDLDDLDALLDEVEQFTETQPAPAVMEDEDDFSLDWLEDISQQAVEEANIPDGKTTVPMLDERDLDTGDLAAVLGEENIPPTPTPEPTTFEDLPPEKTIRFEDLLETETEAEPVEDDTSPEWLKIIQEDKAPKPQQAEPEFDMFTEEAEPEPVVQEIATEAPVGDVLEDQDDFSMDWLDSISQEAAEEAGVGREEFLAPSAETPQEEVPDWLSSIEDEDEEAELGEGLENLDAIFGTEEEHLPEPDLLEPRATLVPEWLQEIAEDKPASEPGPEPEWLPEIEEPAAVEDIQPVQEEEWQPEVKAKATAETPAVQPQAAAPVPSPAAKPVAPAVGEAITAARQAVQGGNLDAAIKHFNAIIKKGKQLDLAIVEIKEALRRHPVNVELWQVLGDAYMKDNNLQDALDAYSKAENLLR